LGPKRKRRGRARKKKGCKRDWREEDLGESRREIREEEEEERKEGTEGG
jgi:hypothetical protein